MVEWKLEKKRKCKIWGTLPKRKPHKNNPRGNSLKEKEQTIKLVKVYWDPNKDKKT